MTFKIPDFTPNELFFYRNYTFLPLINLSDKVDILFQFLDDCDYPYSRFIAPLCHEWRCYYLPAAGA